MFYLVQDVVINSGDVYVSRYDIDQLLFGYNLAPLGPTELITYGDIYQNQFFSIRVGLFERDDIVHIAFSKSYFKVKKYLYNRNLNKFQVQLQDSMSSAVITTNEEDYQKEIFNNLAKKSSGCGRYNPDCVIVESHTGIHAKGDTFLYCRTHKREVK